MAQLTVVEFIEARLGERERLAHAVVGCTYEQYSATWDEPSSGVVVCGPGVDAMLPTGDSTLSRFIVDNDPATVLAGIEAVRTVLGLHSRPETLSYGTFCTACGCIDCNPMGWPCATLLALARPYVGHRDFKPEWRAR